jgi:hypothetical protein
MRVESIAKKISCTVVKTSLLRGAGDVPTLRPWDEDCQLKRVMPLVQVNPPKRAFDITGILFGIAPQSVFLDYYA